MKTAGKCLVALIISLLLQSCTIAYLDVRNNLNPGTPAKQRESCNFNYSLSLASVSDTNSFGVKDDTLENVQKYKKQYKESTKEIFNKKSCITNYVEDEKDANFKIKVIRDQHRSALPQEWLTGLSFGLIPSWGTRENEYQYIFENVNKNKINTYYVDEHSFSHIILFPIFWVSFFTLDEDKVYKEALLNFIDGNLD